MFVPEVIRQNLLECSLDLRLHEALLDAVHEGLFELTGELFVVFDHVDVVEQYIFALLPTIPV